MKYKSFDEINEKIKNGKALVLTAEEVIEMAKENGIKKTFESVDVVTTATFGPMCSSGVFINFGHSNPPIKMRRVWLNDVPAYAGIAAVDAYIGATEMSESGEMEYGGAHVIEDLIAGKDVKLYAESYGTDCYPRKEITTYINKNNVNQAYMFNPRNAYQNYTAGTNSTDKTIYTYMGTLLPNFGNITYSTSGQLSPLLNDPYLRTIGIGTRIFIGGGIGYVAWEGTQHFPSQIRNEKGVPIKPASSLALIADIKNMNTDYIRAAIFEKYGVSLFVGIGIPIPILDEDMLLSTLIEDKDINVVIVDKSGKEGDIKTVDYAQLRSGMIEIRGKNVQTAPLSSLKRARQIANHLKGMLNRGEFLISQPVDSLPMEGKISSLDIRGNGNEKG